MATKPKKPPTKGKSLSKTDDPKHTEQSSKQSGKQSSKQSSKQSGKQSSEQSSKQSSPKKVGKDAPSTPAKKGSSKPVKKPPTKTVAKKSAATKTAATKTAATKTSATKTKATKTSAAAKAAPKKSAPSKAPSKKPASKKAASAKNVDLDLDPDEPRRLGIRGAAPWAARHAAKHAAEARARAAEPPPPGSARATLRVPSGAEQIKARIVQLHNALSEIKTLRKNLGRNFYTIGRMLRDIRESRLYEVRGFGSFETFLEREVELGKTAALRLARVVEVFHEEAAAPFGMERVLHALAVLESGPGQNATAQPHASSPNPPPLPLKPPDSRK